MKPIFHFGCGLVMGSFLTMFLASLWGISSLNEKSQTDEKETAQVVQQEQPSAPETTAGESKTHQSRTVEKRTVSAQPQKRAKKQEPEPQHTAAKPQLKPVTTAEIAAETEALPEEITQQTPPERNTRTTRTQEEESRQYTEIQWKGESYSLYIGMPKEAVREIFGKPGNVNVMNLYDGVHENWQYRSRGHMLMLSFINGKLDGIMQL
ncbi:hypothetical protein [Bacteroides sp. ET225]|uniref:hypothetical protein n=1 Tax=Bacteroides sp. ET225 TaxID=2972461 RepID=UPI0021AC41A4|nr:hypothetical protein [Bacteroides sp. ET225]MCR8918146.1 hypothetical protein [Bacteroides sp. ET225]